MSAPLLTSWGAGPDLDWLPLPHAGVDEAGRGCLAGPVVAAAVILAPGVPIAGLRDSKQLSPARRTQLESAVKERAWAWGLGVAWPGEIDRVNVLRATLRAMCRAVRSLAVQPGGLVIDGNQRLDGLIRLPQAAVVRGDDLVPAVSAASILAKTFRDRLMEHLDRRWPGYGFAGHKGYGTKAHQEALEALGPCPMHRRSFRGVETDREGGQPCLPGI